VQHFEFVRCVSRSGSAVVLTQRDWQFQRGRSFGEESAVCQTDEIAAQGLARDCEAEVWADASRLARR
jgi:hypothetical protein